MTSFISGGHHAKDPGAIGSGTTEFKWCAEFRDLVTKSLLKIPGIKVINDKDFETLAQYLNRIKTGNGSVSVEFHLDASETHTATGCTCLVANNYNKLSKQMGDRIGKKINEITGLRFRGTLTEKDSNRGRLAFTHLEGITVLVELGFIDNQNDMNKLNLKKQNLADAIAEIIAEYDKMID